jgi:hypothetical protein
MVISLILTFPVVVDIFSLAGPLDVLLDEAGGVDGFTVA